MSRPAPAAWPSIEPLEARIAPAVLISNPLPDVKVGIGKSGTSFDLTQLTAPASSSAYHTRVQFITNYDTDPNTAGIQAGVINLELFDDLAPLTVQNFLAHLNNANARGDYDGTLIHRAAFANGVPFVLQGGGFEAATPSVHIPVFPTLHNEADIVNRSNLAGTVAMAKVGGDPNSATSEWFVNLGNNSANLDNQNGGFTVFGKVDAAGLILANTIANLPKGNVGAGNDTPLQNGTPIQVVDAVIIPGTPNPTPTLTYTVEAVTPVGVTPADTVAATIVNGAQLKLAYGAGKSGAVNVTVKVSDGVSSVTDTFAVEVRPNFTVALTNDALPGFLIPGDAGSLKVSVGNSGGSAGTGKVNLFLTQVTVTKNASGVITNYVDVNPAVKIDLATADFSVDTGAKQDLTVPVKLSNAPFRGGDAFYRVISEVVPTDTPLTQEEFFSDDNRSLAVSLHDVGNRFGTLSDVNFPTRVAVLKYAGTSANSQPAVYTWAVKGAGSGTVVFDQAGEESGLSVRGTSLSSSIVSTIPINGTRIGFQQVDFADPFGTANLAKIDVTGAINASGGFKSLTLGDVTGEALFLIGAAPAAVVPTKAVLKLGNVKDLRIESSQPLASLTVASWRDTSTLAKDAILGTSLGKLIVRGTGDFEANVTLTDETARVGSIAIGGFLRNATIQTAGDIGAVKLGGINKSNVFAGVTERPTSLAAFSDPHKISSFTLTGIRGVTAPLFVDSQVAAQTLGTIKVKNVATTVAGGAGASGFVADVIASYSRPGVPTKTKLTQDYDDAVDGVNVGYLVKVL